jgi:hypothetical protein
MKIRSVSANNRKGEFRVVTGSGSAYVFPYVKGDPQPEPGNRVVEVVADRELANEAFTYTLESGDEGSIHVEQVLEYNRDPGYLREALLYQLSLEAGRRIDRSGLSRRELARRLRTSASQLYRLLDPENKKKTIDQLVSLLQVLDCDVEISVRDAPAPRPARRSASTPPAFWSSIAWRCPTILETKRAPSSRSRWSATTCRSARSAHSA